MTAPFVILGTPRSRTAWLAKFLAFEGRRVLHEPSTDFRSVNDLYALLEDRLLAGISDSMLTLRWRDVVNAAPEARIVVVFRPHDEIMMSLTHLFICNSGQQSAEPLDHRIREYQRRVDRLLHQIATAIDEMSASVPVLTVPFSALDAEATADLVFRYCIREPLPPEWWHAWRGENVQADFGASLARAAANAEGLRAVYPELLELEAAR